MKGYGIAFVGRRDSYEQAYNSRNILQPLYNTNGSRYFTALALIVMPDSFSGRSSTWLCYLKKSSQSALRLLRSLFDGALITWHEHVGRFDCVDLVRYSIMSTASVLGSWSHSSSLSTLNGATVGDLWGFDGASQQWRRRRFTLKRGQMQYDKVVACMCRGAPERLECLATCASSLTFVIALFDAPFRASKGNEDRQILGSIVLVSTSVVESCLVT